MKYTRRPVKIYKVNETSSTKAYYAAYGDDKPAKKICKEEMKYWQALGVKVVLPKSFIPPKGFDWRKK